MLGLETPAIWSAYLCCILSTLICIIYGAINWNKGDDQVFPEDKKWLDDEKQVEDTL